MKDILYYSGISVTSSCICAYFISVIDDRFSISILNQNEFLMPYTVVSCLSYGLYSYYVTKGVDDMFRIPSMLGCAVLDILLPISLYMIGDREIEKPAILALLIALMLYVTVTPFIYRPWIRREKILQLMHLLVLPILSTLVLCTFGR